ncbi:hypothetical protein AKJ16_DCAP20334 [Drosera capensis]
MSIQKTKITTTKRATGKHYHTDALYMVHYPPPVSCSESVIGDGDTEHRVRFLSLSVIFSLRAQSSSFDSLLRRLHRVPGDGESSQGLVQIIAAIICRVSHSA